MHFSSQRQSNSAAAKATISRLKKMARKGKMDFFARRVAGDLEVEVAQTKGVSTAGQFALTRKPARHTDCRANNNVPAETCSPNASLAVDGFVNNSLGRINQLPAHLWNFHPFTRVRICGLL